MELIWQWTEEKFIMKNTKFS